MSASSPRQWAPVSSSQDGILAAPAVASKDATSSKCQSVAISLVSGFWCRGIEKIFMKIKKIRTNEQNKLMFQKKKCFGHKTSTS